jgi:hypothetical protein
MHNKWLQALENNMTDLYDATLDDFCRTALQSIGYHNFLKGLGCGTGPDRKVLKLWSATRSGDPKKIAQAVSDLSSDAGLNSRAPHLEGEFIFSSAKRKLDLPPGDDSNSHCHDHMNFLLPKLGWHMSHGQSHQRKNEVDIFPVPPSTVAFTASGILVYESKCANPSAWRIERIKSSSQCLCKGQLPGMCYNSKISKWRRATTAPTFTGIQKIFKGKGTKEKQFWFCPHNVNGCVLTRSKWIIHYPQIPHAWPVKVGTNLTQVEVEALEVVGFQIDSGEVFDRMRERFLARYNNVPRDPQPPKGSGDIRPKMKDNQPFRFVADPSPEHCAKMALAKDIDYKVLKYLKVPPPGYGIIYIVHTPGSIAKQQLYKVTVEDFPACTCIDFISMKASALGNGKKKWICCKHLYFILQRFMGCTLDDKFVHCPAWTFNEVNMLLDRAEAINYID